MLGPGKYDPIATEARIKAQAEGVLLIILNGQFGHGFSVQAPLEISAALPTILRDVADDIEKTLSQGRA